MFRLELADCGDPSTNFFCSQQQFQMQMKICHGQQMTWPMDITCVGEISFQRHMGLLWKISKTEAPIMISHFLPHPHRDCCCCWNVPHLGDIIWCGGRREGGCHLRATQKEGKANYWTYLLYCLENFNHIGAVFLIFPE